MIRNARILHVARRCSWCRGWLSRADYIAAHKHNARVKEGCMCEPCARKFEAGVDSVRPPEAA